MKSLRIIVFTISFITINCNSSLLNKELVIVMSENSNYGHNVIIFNTERGENNYTDSIFFDQNNLKKIRNIELPVLLNNVKFIKKVLIDTDVHFIKLPVYYDYSCNDTISIFGVVSGKTYTHQSDYLLFLYGNCDSSEIYLNSEAKLGFDD